MATVRLTTAQAIIKFLKNQYVHRDGQEIQFFAGVLGIFGHGNVAGIGQALQENPDFPYILVRNEQSGVHLACGFTKMKNRMQTFACTSSIGPGANENIEATTVTTTAPSGRVATAGALNSGCLSSAAGSTVSRWLGGCTA